MAEVKVLSIRPDPIVIVDGPMTAQIKTPAGDIKTVAVSAEVKKAAGGDAVAIQDALQSLVNKGGIGVLAPSSFVSNVTPDAVATVGPSADSTHTVTIPASIIDAAGGDMTKVGMALQKTLVESASIGQPIDRKAAIIAGTGFGVVLLYFVFKSKKKKKK